MLSWSGCTHFGHNGARASGKHSWVYLQVFFLFNRSSSTPVSGLVIQHCQLCCMTGLSVICHRVLTKGQFTLPKGYGDIKPPRLWSRSMQVKWWHCTLKTFNLWLTQLHVVLQLSNIWRGHWWWTRCWSSWRVNSPKKSFILCFYPMVAGLCGYIFCCDIWLFGLINLLPKVKDTVKH